MSTLLNLKQIVTGKRSTYTILKELQRAADEGAVYLAHNQSKESCIVKSIRGHWRLQNEADILARYQPTTRFIRPLIDKIVDPLDPPSIVLKHLDSELRTESKRKRLTRPEIKQVAKCILEALLPLHKDGMVHTGKFSIRLGSPMLTLCLLCQTSNSTTFLSTLAKKEKNDSPRYSLVISAV
jgi:hypothetical protein